MNAYVKEASIQLTTGVPVLILNLRGVADADSSPGYKITIDLSDPGVGSQQYLLLMAYMRMAPYERRLLMKNHQIDAMGSFMGLGVQIRLDPVTHLWSLQPL